MRNKKLIIVCMLVSSALGGLDGVVSCMVARWLSGQHDGILTWVICLAMYVPGLLLIIKVTNKILWGDRRSHMVAEER